MKRKCMMVAAAFLIVVVGIPAAKDKKSKGREFQRTFDAPVERVYVAAVQTAASHYHLQYSDKDARTFSFSTGRNMRTWKGFDVSGVVTDAGQDRATVTLHPQMRDGSSQIFSWKEGNRIARQFLDAVGRALTPDTGKAEEESATT